MNARNKLNTHRINTYKSGDGVSLKTEGSWGSGGSSHTDSTSRVEVGSL